MPVIGFVSGANGERDDAVYRVEAGAAGGDFPFFWNGTGPRPLNTPNCGGVIPSRSDGN